MHCVQAYELVQGPLVRWTEVRDRTLPPPPTAVLLHGILGSRKNWGNWLIVVLLVSVSFAKRLAQAFPTWQFLLCDLRCHGDSTLLQKAGPHGVASAASDVLQLMGQLRITPRVLIGHSFGGKGLGVRSFVEGQLRARLEEHLQPAARLPELQDMQLPLAMLTKAIAQSPQYLTRATPPSPGALAAYADFDAGMVTSLAALVRHQGFPQSPAAFHQATLPLSHSGPGLRPLVRSCRAAYLGSWAQTAASVAQRFLVHGRRALEQAVVEVETGVLPFQASLRSAHQELLAAHPDLEGQAVSFAHLAHTADLR
eukprot:SM000013S26537  [mRNA]  locus=s13:963160:965471:+ [translate_table: standard]